VTRNQRTAFADDGVAWLGDFPNRWTLSPLGLHFTQRSEIVSDSEFPPLSVTKIGVVPRLDSAAKTANGDQRKLVRKGDFAINSRSDRKGSSGISDLDGSVSVVYTVLKPRSSILARFAHHLLRSPAFQEEYFRWGSGIVDDLWSTRFSGMKRIMLAVPPLEEQERIADYLDRETAQIDTLIEAQQRLVETLRERRASAIQARLIELDGKLTRLKYQANIQTGVTLSGTGNEGLPEWSYLRVANVQNGYVDTTHVKRLRLAESEARPSLLQSGDVLMTEGGDIDKLGRGSYWAGEIEPCLHQNHVFAVRPGADLDPHFLVFLLDGPVARNYFRSTARKTTNLASTNKWTLGNLPLRLPPIEAQREAVAYLDEQSARVDGLIAEAERFIELSRERRSALITAAVTGQIDVRNEAA
jgi:type I restriction enzyme S subunit